MLICLGKSEVLFSGVLNYCIPVLYNENVLLYLLFVFSQNNKNHCRVLSLSDRRYSLNPLSQTRID